MLTGFGVVVSCTHGKRLDRENPRQPHPTTDREVITKYGDSQMNWFTNTALHLKSDEERVAACKDADNKCEHCQADPLLAYSIGREHDRFGSESTCQCKACYEEMLDYEGKQLVCCNDCKQQKPRSEVEKWRWYDFYAPQGDEALNVCITCTALPRHIERVRKDREDYEWEMGHR